MLEITYLDEIKQEKTVTFASKEDFDRSQQTCMIGIADYFKVTKLTYKGHELAYSGTYGGIFFYLLQEDLSQFD